MSPKEQMVQVYCTKACDLQFEFNLFCKRQIRDEKFLILDWVYNMNTYFLKLITNNAKVIIVTYTRSYMMMPQTANQSENAVSAT